MLLFSVFESVFGLEDAVPSSPLIWQEMKHSHDINDTFRALRCLRLLCVVIPQRHQCVCLLSVLSGRLEENTPNRSSPSQRIIPPKGHQAEHSQHCTIPPKCLSVFQKCHFLRVSYSFFFLFPSRMHSSFIPAPPYQPPCPLLLFPNYTLLLFVPLVPLSLVKQGRPPPCEVCLCCSIWSNSNPFQGLSARTSCRMKPARFICHWLSALHWPGEGLGWGCNSGWTLTGLNYTHFW